MKRFFRAITLSTALVFSGLVAAEAFHGMAAHHSETNCPVCQVVHDTPVIAQAPQTLLFQERPFALPFAANVFHLAYSTPILGGRSPPAA